MSEHDMDMANTRYVKRGKTVCERRIGKLNAPSSYSEPDWTCQWLQRGSVHMWLR